MIRHLGSSLTDVTYVFDEPTIGLHPHDIERMNQLLLQLRDKGNTVLVVEHKPETIAIADHVVDLGPGAGTAGGEVVFEGTFDAAAQERHRHRPAPRRPGVAQGRRCASPRGARGPQGLDATTSRTSTSTSRWASCACSPASPGSGKSSLIHGSVAGRDGVVVVDQGAIKGSRRSNPATYTGLLEPIRKAFAKATGEKAALFSANSEGACPGCNGAGVIFTELGVMATVESPCEECEGRRFQASVLEHRFGGKNIVEVLDMPVSEALEFFGEGEAATPAAHKVLVRLMDVGLGYVNLGQPLTTLSGGERQRLKLAVQMAEKGDVYILDEPTTGLHLADVEQLLGLLDRLVDSGQVGDRHRAPPGRDGARRLDHRPRPGRRPRRRHRSSSRGRRQRWSRTKKTLTGKHLAAYVAGLTAVLRATCCQSDHSQTPMTWRSVGFVVEDVRQEPLRHLAQLRALHSTPAHVGQSQATDRPGPAGPQVSHQPGSAVCAAVGRAGHPAASRPGQQRRSALLAGLRPSSSASAGRATGTPGLQTG